MTHTAPPATPLPGGRAPLYSRLRQAMRDRIASGEWRPGDQIPTIRRLGESYGVSHITVVQALETLAREGLLIRWQGKGVFVGQPRPEEPRIPRIPRIPLMSFTEEAIGRGQTPGSRTLRLRHEPATPGLIARLCLSVDEGVVLLERLRSLDGLPLGFQQAYLPEHLVPGLVERSQPIESLYLLLADAYAVLPTNASETYLPISLDLHQARLLETRPGAPAFQVERNTSDQHGRPIEFSRSVLRGDRYSLRLCLSRSGG
jgi:GntR family transcriptional regulator